MSTFKPALKFNCPENWDKMKIGLVSRHCDNCQREVQDFTKMTKEEILQFLWSNRNDKVCGRIHKSQLDYHHQEILITIDSYIQKNKNSNLSFYLLAVGTMILLSCSENSIQDKVQKANSLTVAPNAQNEELRKKIIADQIYKSDSLLPPIVGILAIDDSLVVNDKNRARMFTEVMPEFTGGVENLFIYIQKNLKYPDWERRNKIEGKVFVTFIVDKEGKIQEPEIIRSVDGSRNFDTEVLRLIREMPDWKPAQEQGENVAVHFTLPIGFKL